MSAPLMFDVAHRRHDEDIRRAEQWRRAHGPRPAEPGTHGTSRLRWRPLGGLTVWPRLRHL